MTNFDFGFNSDEFQGELSTVPYCQFLNGNANVYGMAITSSNAELAGFMPDNNWHLTEYAFDDGTQENLYMTRQPRLLIINRSQPLMTDGTVTLPYDRDKYDSSTWKAFSYTVVLPVGADNKPLSDLPFRLKCSGFAGITFQKNYAYYNNADSFTKKFLQVYKTLTGDRAINKNDVFFAHAVYEPTLVRKKATSSYNGQSSQAVQTESFTEPTKDNFVSLIIKNGSPASNKIKEFIEETKEWLKTAPVEQEETETESNTVSGYPETDPVEAGLHPAATVPNAVTVAPVIKDSEQEEMALDVWNIAMATGWTRNGFNTYLMNKYKTGIDKLNILPKQALISISSTIQDSIVRDMYCPNQPVQTDIPF